MATFTVLNVDDSGVGSLRWALAEAESNGPDQDKIVFDAGLAGQSIHLQSRLVLSSGQVKVVGDISGDGLSDITISADRTGDGASDDDVSLMRIEAEATVRLVALQLTGGYARGSDGCYYSTCPIGYGEAAFAGVRNAGQLTIKDSVISNNTAIAGRGQGHQGRHDSGIYGGDAQAGIFNTGRLKVLSSVLEGNTALGGDGGQGDYIMAGRGGSAVSGVFNAVGGTAVLRDVTFSAGLAVGGDGGPFIPQFEEDDDYPGAGGMAVVGVHNFGDVSGRAAGNDGRAQGGNGGTVRGSEETGVQGDGFYLLANSGISTLKGTILTKATTGSDHISGYDGIDDLLFGRNGSDTLLGLGGADRLNGGAGNDVVDGGRGEDLLLGKAGDDTLLGGDGNDHLLGGGGKDQLTGNSGGDVLVGGKGNDVLNGGAGSDEIVGGLDWDHLFGGDGGDIFVFRPGDGYRDRVRDFKDGVDLIVFRGSRFDKMDDLKFFDTTLFDGGSGLVVKYDHGSFVLDGYSLKDLDSALISAADFVFE